jgi:hypothetical protein
LTFACHLCGASLENENGIPIIGANLEDRHARLIDGAGRHMAVLHPEIIQQINYGSAALGYLILIANIRTDQTLIHNRTKAMLGHTVVLVDNLRQELSEDAQRELNLRTF